MTVVIDCNIFVMCLTSRSPYYVIYKAMVNGRFHIAVTTEMMLEYEEIIQQKYSVQTASAFAILLRELPNVTLIHPYYKWQLIAADADDNKYCDCAIAGQAAYIVTEDRHFHALKNISFPKLSVIGIDAFCELLENI